MAISRLRVHSVDRLAAVALLFLAAACGTGPKSASEGAAAAVVGSIECGALGYLPCVVLGVPVFATWGALNSASPNTGRPSPDRASPISRTSPISQASPIKLEFLQVATVGPDDVFPEGTLHVAKHTVRNVGENEKGAWLVVNFAVHTEKGERSYGADTRIDCGSGMVSISWAATFDLVNGSGNPIDGKTPSATTIEKPSEALASAVNATCGF